MVILGGLELVAAGYLVHKHQKHKKEKVRLAEEAAALEESQYRIYSSPPDRSSSTSGPRRRRSHSPDSNERRRERRERRDRYDQIHSEERKYTNDTPPPRRDSGKPSQQQINIPPPQQQASIPLYHAQVPVPTVIPPFQQAPYPQHAPAMHTPPPPAYNTLPVAANYTPPQDMKYGWTDDEPVRPPQQDPHAAPTGWPAHWSQSQTPATLAQPTSLRHERRTRTPEPGTSRVRFDVPSSVGGSSARSSRRTPPPSYRH